MQFVSLTDTDRIINKVYFQLGQHMKLNLQYSLGNATANQGESNTAPKSNSTSQRRGSTTSTQSMPMETQSHPEVGAYAGRRGHGTKSASMSPVGGGLVPGQGIGFSQAQILSRAEGKKGSNVSVHSMASVPTPTLASPSKGAGMLPRGAVTPSPTLARPRIGMTSTLATSISR